ncbi:MAG: septum formation protein Maf [Fibrobacteres bacterium]|nr:septum formation protein Maf [Fibrobacterota bacterium]
MHTLKRTLYLASQSPRRNDLLSRFGFPFERLDAEVSEETPLMKPIAKVKLLAKRKAVHSSEKIKKGLVLGFDTVVNYGDKILEKPTSHAEAFRMLKFLSGRTHTVYTGIVLLIKPENKFKIHAAATKVTFRKLSDKEIKSYIESGEPMDKAGAYGIQGAGGSFVEKVNGCFFNVVGLPVKPLMEFLSPFMVK